MTDDQATDYANHLMVEIHMLMQSEILEKLYSTTAMTHSNIIRIG